MNCAPGIYVSHALMDADDGVLIEVSDMRLLLDGLGDRTKLKAASLSLKFANLTS